MKNNKVVKIVTLALVGIVSSFVISNIAFADGYTNVSNAGDFKNAIVAGKSVKLTDSFELSEPITITATNITIDLNGKVLSYESDEAGEAMFTNKGSLTITDSSSTAKGKISFKYVGEPDTSYDKGNYTISNGGTLVLEKGTVENTTAKMKHACYAIDNNAINSASSLTINGGSVVNTYNYSIRQIGSLHQNIITINDGIVSGTRAVWIQLPGSTATVKPNVSFNVNGGKLIATGEDGGYKLVIYSYSYGNSLENVDLTDVAAGVVVKSVADSKVTANGVTVTEEGITVKALVKVELPSLVPTEKVDEVTVGVSDSSNITNVFIELLNQKVQSENNQEFTDIVANNHIEVEVDITNVTEEQIDEQVKSEMEKVAGEATISTFFDITLAIKNTTNGLVIGELEELTEEIELMILLPEELKNTNNKVNRNYYIIRRHVTDNGVEIEKIKAQLSEDGNSLVFKTDKFSTYALAYEDVYKLTANPVTSDNLSLYLIIGSISIVGIAVTVIRSRKKI